MPGATARSSTSTTATVCRPAHFERTALRESPTPRDTGNERPSMSAPREADAAGEASESPPLIAAAGAIRAWPVGRVASLPRILVLLGWGAAGGAWDILVTGGLCLRQGHGVPYPFHAR